MTLIIALYLIIIDPPTDAEVSAFRSVVPGLLTTADARAHLTVARAAGAVHGVPPARLLAVAWHESLFRPDTVTREPGNRVSCGVMTPMPRRRCAPGERTLIGGYDIGAEHLAWWATIHPHPWAHLTAYAGGTGLVRVCRRGRWMVRGRNICVVAGDFLSRERRITHAIAKASKGSS